MHLHVGGKTGKNPLLTRNLADFLPRATGEDDEDDNDDEDDDDDGDDDDNDDENEANMEEAGPDVAFDYFRDILSKRDCKFARYWQDVLKLSPQTVKTYRTYVKRFLEKLTEEEVGAYHRVPTINVLLNYINYCIRSRPGARVYTHAKQVVKAYKKFLLWKTRETAEDEDEEDENEHENENELEIEV